MATNNQNQELEEPEPFQMPSPKQEKDIVTILGVQGLSHNDFSALELKIMLQVIKKYQKLIDYCIRYQVSRDTFFFTAEQRAAGHIDLCMKLSEFNLADTRHASQLRNALLQMAKQPLNLAYKLGSQTFYTQFDQLFECKISQCQGRWWVKLRFDLHAFRFFFSFDKGACHIDLNVVQQCRGASSIKLYILMNCWGAKGYTMVKPENLMALLHGRKDCYKTWSAFKNKALDFACNDLKRLYDMGIINQYPVYQPFYKSEEAEVHHSMPDHITIFFKDRQNTGDTTDGSKASEELQGVRARLKWRLLTQYHVDDKIAAKASQRLALDMLGELDDWFQKKDYFIRKCQQEHRKINVGAYIAKALDGFFKDHHA